MSAGGKHVFFHHPFRFSFGAPITKDRWKREKHVKLPNISFMWLGSLHKEMKTQRSNSASGLWLWVWGAESHRGVTGQEGAWATRGACFRGLSVSRHWRQDAPVLAVREDSSRMTPYDLLRGRSESPSYLVFHKFPHLRILSTPRCCILGQHVLSLITIRLLRFFILYSCNTCKNKSIFPQQ